MLLTDLPQELLIECLKAADHPADVLRASLACRTLALHSKDELLWEALYVKLFDRCPPALFPKIKSWREACVKRLWVAHLLTAGDVQQINAHVKDIKDALVSIAETASPESVRSAIWLEEVYANGGIAALRRPESGRKLRTRSDYGEQDLAHCRLLRAPLAYPDEERKRARSIIYSLDNYSAPTWYGPFHPDGTVNWRLLEAVHATIMPSIVNRFPEELDDDDNFMRNDQLSLPPSGFTMTLPWPAQVPEIEDWAGIEEFSLIGTYSFVEYSTFHRYNFHIDRRAMNFEDDNHLEGLGELMLFRLKLIARPFSEATDCSDIPSSGRLKPLYFRGTSTALPQEGDRAVTGSVLETPDGQLRWRFMISYAGEGRWSLEGVQLGHGGPIMLCWSDASRDEEGPVGSACYWRGPRIEDLPEPDDD